ALVRLRPRLRRVRRGPGPGIRVHRPTRPTRAAEPPVSDQPRRQQDRPERTGDRVEHGRQLLTLPHDGGEWWRVRQGTTTQPRRGTRTATSRAPSPPVSAAPVTPSARTPACPRTLSPAAGPAPPGRSPPDTAARPVRRRPHGPPGRAGIKWTPPAGRGRFLR